MCSTLSSIRSNVQRGDVSCLKNIKTHHLRNFNLPVQLLYQRTTSNFLTVRLRYPRSLVSKDTVCDVVDVVCVPFIINQTPAAGGDHVTAPSGLRSRVCGQSLRPSLAPNHFLTGDRGTQLLRAIRLREDHSSRGGGPGQKPQFMSEVDRFLTGKSPKCLRL